jgi:hypothetical protein
MNEGILSAFVPREGHILEFKHCFISHTLSFILRFMKFKVHMRRTNILFHLSMESSLDVVNEIFALMVMSSDPLHAARFFKYSFRC